MSVFRNHKLKHQARQAAEQAAKTGQVSQQAPESLHLQLLALEQDVTRLRALDRIADRIAMKRDELLPKYRPYAEQYLAKCQEPDAKPHDNPLFAQVIVWLFDVGDFDTALDWADIAIAQDQKTPATIKRDWPHFVADTVLEWAEQEIQRGNAVEPWFGKVLGKVLNDWRLNEQLTAKWLKTAGLLLLTDEDGKPVASAISDQERLQQADELLAKAAEFHPAIGVKTHRERIAMRLRALEAGKV